MTVFSASPLILGAAMFGMIVLIFVAAFIVLLVGKTRAKKANEFDLPGLDIKSVDSHRKIRKGTSTSTDVVTMEEWAAETSHMSEQEEKMFNNIPLFFDESSPNQGGGGLYDAPELAHNIEPSQPDPLSAGSEPPADEPKHNFEPDGKKPEPAPPNTTALSPNPLIPPLSKRRNS